MRRIDWPSLDAEGRADALSRPPLSRSEDLRAQVAAIIANVRTRGDAALLAYAARFDQAELDALELADAEYASANESLDDSLKQAINEAAGRITAFHRACMNENVAVDTAPGLRVERVMRPIERVGLYVPAGSAPLPSTVLMLAIPARLAGCTQVVLCTPPRADGSIDSAVAYAARLCGVHRVFKAGGAQAVAAMAYGNASVPRCDKLFGPGNAYVTEAKLQVASDPAGAAIDMPAGPSEVLVIADEGANPVFVAADLLSQAEHGPDSQVLLVSNSGKLLDAVASEIERQCLKLPRGAIASRALLHSRLVRVDSLAEAVEVSNLYAPEHLIVQVRDARRLLDAIRNAGSVFLGDWTPESLGDYCSGSNHVLPTYGWARSCSGVSVASFQKRITVQTCTAMGLREIGPCAMTLAEAEGLDGHRRAVALRLADIDTRPSLDAWERPSSPNTLGALEDPPPPDAVGVPQSLAPLATKIAWERPSAPGGLDCADSFGGLDALDTLTTSDPRSGHCEKSTGTTSSDRQRHRMNPLDLARPEIRNLQPYSSARMEARGGATLLNANESPWPPFADSHRYPEHPFDDSGGLNRYPEPVFDGGDALTRYPEPVFEGTDGLNRYPDPQPEALLARLANLYGVGADQVLVGRGSDEGIDLLVRAFCAAGRDAILISPPTFGMYETSAKVQDAAVIEVPLREDFSLDVAGLLKKVTPAVKLVFVCAPNNPSGAGVARATILRLAEALAGRALLVVDEAYIEFAEPGGDNGSVADALNQFENLVVLRTLSKAWSLAGARLGVLLADARVITLLRKIMSPYPLPTPCVNAALHLLATNRGHAIHEYLAVMLRERTRMRAAVGNLACVREVLPSEANFLAVRFHDADAALETLSHAGIVVRDIRRYPMLEDALRITLGTPEENDHVLQALTACRRDGSARDDGRGLRDVGDVGVRVGTGARAGTGFGLDVVGSGTARAASADVLRELPTPLGGQLSSAQPPKSGNTRPGRSARSSRST